MVRHPVSFLGPGWRVVGGIGLLLCLALGGAGCSTVGRTSGAETRRALRRMPPVPAGHERTDRALVAAFFAAHGIQLDPAQSAQIIPPAARAGRMNRNALLQAARQHNRLLMVVKADADFLWEELGRNQPLLVLLPPDIRYHPDAVPLIPVAWDRARGEIELLAGSGEIQKIPEALFFARRAPLKQAALRMLTPHQLTRLQPTRAEELVLADFWFDRGSYRRADAAYEAILDDELLDSVNVDALIGRGNVLVREGRPAQAIPLFSAALALEPDNPQILNNLAYAMLHGHGSLLVALRHAEKAHRLAPGNPIFLETIGSIHLGLGDAAAAAKFLEQAWARAARHPPEVQIAIMDQLVRAWNAADRPDLARQVAEARRRAFPETKFPRDILAIFPALRQAPAPARKPAHSP